MLERIGGPSGVVGLLGVLGGIGLIATDEPIVAAGLLVVLIGLALLVRGIVQGVMASMGMGGMF
jgi:uncharacterized membrane protein HdeD (DUF308 family)